MKTKSKIGSPKPPKKYRDPDKYVTIPHDLLENFLGDPENFMRDIACVSTESVSPFFKRKDKVAEFDRASSHIKNPFDDDRGALDDTFAPARDDNFARYIHIDLGLVRDAVGITMCHAPFFVDRIRSVFKDGKPVKEKTRLPYIKFDFIGRIKASRGEEIIFSEIRNILYDISSRGFYVHVVTYDGFQSVDSVQILQSQGYRVSRLSIDRTSTKLIYDKNYDKNNGLRRISTDGQTTAAVQALKDALYDDRLEAPYHPYVKKEMDGAEIDYRKNKVDHRARGTIDVLHSMAGSVYNLTNNEREYIEDYTEDEYNEQIGDDFYNDLATDDPAADMYSNFKDPSHTKSWNS